MKRLEVPLNTQSHQSITIDLDNKCEWCNGAGFTHPLKETGIVDYSSVVPCRHCITPGQIRRRLGVSSLDSTFNNFHEVAGSGDALKAAKQMATLTTDWKLLLIYGKWGSGKTHLLESIAIELWEQGRDATIYIFPEFIGRLKETFDRSRDSKDDTFGDVMNGICKKQFLLIDDVGAAGSFTNFALAQLERIILARYRENAFTAFTTNVDYNELPEFIVSRFSDTEKARIIYNRAGDYRPRKGVK